MELRDAFIKRSGRFRLLDRGLALAGWQKDAPILEAGCATGEGAAHLAALGYSRVSGVDIDADAVEAAGRLHPGVNFLCADARRLPFADGAFSGIVSEEAFSVIPGKEEVCAEYSRVLAPGGKVLLNDFAVSSGVKAGAPGIPCLDGVQSMARYRELFERAGFACIYEKDEYGEYIGIAMSLGKSFGVPATESGRYIVSAFGRDGYVSDFFAHTRLTCCQMLFEKV